MPWQHHQCFPSFHTCPSMWMIKPLHYHHHHYRSCKRLLQRTRTVGRPSARWHSMQHCWMTQRQRVSWHGYCLVVSHTTPEHLVSFPDHGQGSGNETTEHHAKLAFPGRETVKIIICTYSTVVAIMSWISSRFHLSSIERSFFWAPWTVMGSEINQSVPLH